MAALTRAEMEQAIAEGGVVLYNGIHIGRVEDLPSQASLAGDDEAKVAEARAGLAARQAALNAEQATLDARDKAAQDAAAADAAATTGKGKKGDSAPTEPPDPNAPPAS